MSSPPAPKTTAGRVYVRDHGRRYLLIRVNRYLASTDPTSKAVQLQNLDSGRFHWTSIRAMARHYKEEARPVGMAEMVWRPVVVQSDGGVSARLRQILARKVWGSDGTIAHPPAELTKRDIDYLQGLVDAGVEGAGELINAIVKHGAIEIEIVR